jgi:transcriptional regulator with XRE-family HTH domain
MIHRESTRCSHRLARLSAAGDRSSHSRRKEFADMYGFDRTYVGDVERGERNHLLINIERIALAFGVSLSELFKGV